MRSRSYSTSLCELGAVQSNQRNDHPEMEDGPYLLRAESLDDKHNELVSEQLIYVNMNPLLPVSEDLLIAADQDKYFVGGRAHLLINEPSASEDNPVPVLVTYERDGLLAYESLVLTEPVTRLATPIKETMFPYFIVTVSRFNRGVSPSFASRCISTFPPRPPR